MAGLERKVWQAEGHVCGNSPPHVHNERNRIAIEGVPGNRHKEGNHTGTAETVMGKGITKL